MAYNIPTTEELYIAHKNRLESSIGQSAPEQDKAFIDVLAKTEAGQDIGLYKFASDRAKANFALTAIGDDLDVIGNNENTPRKAAETAILTATLPATTGTVIPATMDFVSDANGLRYRPTADVTAVASVATLTC